MLLDDAEHNLLGLAIRPDLHVCQPYRCVCIEIEVDILQNPVLCYHTQAAQGTVAHAEIQVGRLRDHAQAGMKTVARAKVGEGHLRDRAYAVARAEVRVAHLRDHTQGDKAAACAEVRVGFDVLGGSVGVGHLEIDAHLRCILPSCSELDCLVFGHIECRQTVLSFEAIIVAASAAV